LVWYENAVKKFTSKFKIAKTDKNLLIQHWHKPYLNPPFVWILTDICRKTFILLFIVLF